jgi:hypothetical protein
MIAENARALNIFGTARGFLRKFEVSRVDRGYKLGK